jgi:hypothetical protein
MKPPGKTEYELIAELAYRIYEQEGRPEDRAEEHWRRAERALRQLRLSNPPAESPREPGSPESAIGHPCVVSRP